MSRVREHIKDGQLWKNFNGNWCKQCPKCNRIVESKGGTSDLMYSMSYSITKQQVCHSCIKIGKPSWSSLNRKEFGKMISREKHPMYGRHHTEEMKRNQSKRYIGTKLSEETKRRVSEGVRKSWQNPTRKEKQYASMIRLGTANVACDVGQPEFINKWNNLGFNFKINYLINCDSNLYYVDGYDENKNIVIEYDTHYHNKSYQRVKDKIRQDKIISYLSPTKFWRYNKKTGVFTDVISNQTITTKSNSSYLTERQKDAGFID